MSVKDVVQSLVDDSLIDTERIGTSNYFWSFPSKAANIVSVSVAFLLVLSGPSLSEQKEIDGPQGAVDTSRGEEAALV